MTQESRDFAANRIGHDAAARTILTAGASFIDFELTYGIGKRDYSEADVLAYIENSPWSK